MIYRISSTIAATLGVFVIVFIFARVPFSSALSSWLLLGISLSSFIALVIAFRAGKKGAFLLFLMEFLISSCFLTLQGIWNGWINIS